LDVTEKIYLKCNQNVTDVLLAVKIYVIS